MLCCNFVTIVRNLAFAFSLIFDSFGRGYDNWHMRGVHMRSCNARVDGLSPIQPSRVIRFSPIQTRFWTSAPVHGIPGLTH